MVLKQTIQNLFRFFERLPLHVKVIGSVFLLVVFGYLLIFVVPKPVTFAYSGDNCVRQWTLFPGVAQQFGSSEFEVEFRDVVTIGSHQVFSSKVCFTAVEPPKEGKKTVTISPFGGWIFAKRFAVTVGAAPVAQVADFVGKTLPTTRPVEIALSTPDDLFDYKIKIDEQEADCSHEASKLRCDIESLGLAQGQEYMLTLLRSFEEGPSEEVGSGTITTLLPIVLTQASVAEGQTIYDKPTSFTFEYDKPVETVEAELQIKRGESYEAVAIDTTTDDKKVVITPTATLERNSQFRLTLHKVEAIDGSALPAEYVANFTMSGGPKVVGASVGHTSAPVAGSITLTFDQDITNTDRIKELVSVAGLSASISGGGKKVTLAYSGADRCVDFKITVKKGFESQYGIAQSDDWIFNGRTICYSISTIGYSTQGRAINAYSFGSGGKTILYTGAIHGNERSTKSLMDAWINELEANARSIPAGVRIVVVPLVNPDGYAVNSRYNSRTVDLNRNYDTTDWKADTETTSGQPLPGGGGSAPMSEKETQALAAFTLQLAPYLTMSYHSQAAYAIGNTCGNSASLAAAYAQLSGYRNMTGVSGAFSYEITGTYDDWLCQRYGYQSVLIELASSSNNEFSRNKAALWAMVRS